MFAKRAPSFPDEAALRLLITKKHRDIAICYLILGHFAKFDPLIMDASCQGKVPGLIKAHEKLHSELQARDGMLNWAKELARTWLQEHANDKPLTKVKTTADVIGRVANTAQFDELMIKLQKILGDELAKNVGLCITTTVSFRRFPEETSSDIVCRDLNPYRFLPTDAEATEKNLIDLIYEMRADLAQVSTSVVTKNIREVTTPAYRSSILGATPTAWVDLADQTAEALRFMYTGIISEGTEREIVVQNLFTQMFSILIHCHRTGKGFTALIRRMEMEPVKTEAGLGDKFEGEVVSGGESKQAGDYTYRLTDARILRWIPGSDNFELQNEVSAEDAEKPALHCEMFSYYKKGSGSNGGLDTDNDNEYFATFADKKTNIAWLLVQILVAHPAYICHAKEGSPKDRPVYDQVCVPQTISVASTYLHCEGFILRSLNEGETALSLTNIRKEVLSHAVTHQLSKGMEFTRLSINHVSERRRSPIPLMIRHIRVMSYNEGVEQCNAMLTLHRAHPALRLGGYIARVGYQGLSCKNREIAQTIQDMKNKRAALDLFEKEHPGHKIFITE